MNENKRKAPDAPQMTQLELKVCLGALPVIPTRNLVLFPGVTIPLGLVRQNALEVAKYAFEHDLGVGIFCQKEMTSPEETTPIRTLDEVFPYGVIAKVIQIFDFPDGSHTALLAAVEKVKIIDEVPGKYSPAPCADLAAKVKTVKDIMPKTATKEFTATSEIIAKDFMELLHKSDSSFPPPSDTSALGSDPLTIINTVATQLPIAPQEKIDLLKMFRMTQRAQATLALLTRELNKTNLAHEIRQKAAEEMDNNSRQAFLREQMNAISDELYGKENSEDIQELRQRAAQTKMPEAVKKVFDKELDKLKRQNTQFPDYSVNYTYLETLLDLPWGIETELNNDFAKAEEVLNADHYGLEKVKDRILEQLAVMMNYPQGRAPILCLVGAPGVGKTSLGQSIARSLGREYQRVSLGGLSDEAEIRGHRRTYIGAMPGRIIDALKKAKTSNPVLLLDEVDKIGHDFKGDPQAALLEVLDPEQNCHFHDNYVDVDFDLSQVLFIATANTLQGVSQPLLDRMEIIEISGYLAEEKIEIARQHLIPRAMKAHNVTADELQFSDGAIRAIIERYTAESGVRQLEKAIAGVIRKAVLRKMRQQEWPHVVEESHLHDLLGREVRNNEIYEGNAFPGVVTGLAWTAVGGEILYVESSLAPHKGGEKLTLTGNLGDVMKESAVIALQWVRAHADTLGIDVKAFEDSTLHIHVPEGAIPKDGPSAGITMATSIVSAVTGRKVRPRVAMTGEITLRGKVLPVGGIKEKILAAKRAGITDIIISEENRRDIDDIPSRYLTGLTFHYVATVADVIALALEEKRE